MNITLTPADLTAALPDLSRTHQLPGLANTVHIYRDPWGIPHIKADDEADLFLAQGFATAQDRLWHMDFDRHQALGRWAEWAGPVGIERDRLLRTAGMGRTARLDYQCASTAAKAMVDAYTAGVNAFLETTNTFPVEYKLLQQTPEPWENWQCLAVYKMRNTLLGTFEPKLWRTRYAAAIGAENLARLIRGYPAGHLLTVPPGEIYAGKPLDGLEQLSRAAESANWLNETDPGSNAWAISGEFTRSGIPLVAGDSHRALDTPSVYYQIHLSCRDFNVIGHSVPGMPGAMHFCHNDKVAWGMTYGNADTQDLYIEHFRESSIGREYEFDGAWHPAEVLPEILQVRGAQPVAMEVTITRHGPIIAGDPKCGTAIAIKDPGLITGTPWIDATRDAMHSRTVEELHQSFSKWTDRVNNYAVADVQGNFGYLHEGCIPLRKERNGWSAVPGWSADCEWQGYIPQAELPRSINPDVGYVITCNQRVAGSNYPYYVGLYASPDFRARAIQRRILELRRGEAEPSDMGAIHAERTSKPAQILIAAMADLEVPAGMCGQALELLRTWNLEMDRELLQPTIYAALRARLTRYVATAILGDVGAEHLYNSAGGDAHLRLVALEAILGIEHDDCTLLPTGHTWPQVLLSCLEQAVGDLAERLGDDMQEWQWRRLHRTRPRHPLSEFFPQTADMLDPPGLAVHGDGDTPLAGSHALDDFSVTGLSVNRYIFDPSDWRRSLWIVPLGASGHPASSHYTDQASLWADIRFIPQLWDWDDIYGQAESVQIIEPTHD